MYAYENELNLSKRKIVTLKSTQAKSITSAKNLKVNKKHLLADEVHTGFFKNEIVKMMATIIAIRNGGETGGDLFMTISENIYNENIKNRENNINIITVTSAKKSYKEKIRPNGAWVYSMDEKHGWIFERYDTIEAAIRRSIKIIGSIVLCEGKEIKYDHYDDNTAYYIDLDGTYRATSLTTL